MSENSNVLEVDRRTILRTMGAGGALGITGTGLTAGRATASTCGSLDRETLLFDGDPLTHPDDRSNYNGPKGQRVIYDEDDDTYKMWTSWHWGEGSGEGARVWYAESNDGVTWMNRQQTNIEHSGWYENLRLHSVMKDDGVYKMWFDRYWTNTSCSGWGGWVNYATSTDGVNWTDHGSVFGDREQASVVKTADDRYLIYVETAGDGNCDHEAFRYESTDGENWSNEQQPTLDGTVMRAADGYPYMNFRTVELSPDGSTIVAYGERTDVHDGKQLVKAESPVEDGLHFSTSEIIVDDIQTDNCGNARKLEGVMPQPSNPGSPCFVLYDSDGEHSFRLCITANQAPSVSADAASVTVVEGDTATNTGSYSDPDGDAVSIDASVGQAFTDGSGGWSWEYATTDGPDDSQTVTITATDDDGATDTATFDIVVTNVAPSLSIDLDDTGVSNDPVSLSGSVEDPGADTLTATIDWGDANTDTVSIAQGSSSFSATHVYASGGEYSVAVTVTDDDGGSTSATDSITVTHAVSIDVKPGNGGATDPINPKSNGSIPVAVHTTPDFDATTIDVGSLRFGAPGVVNAGGGATPAHRGHHTDVDDDGDTDLLVHFSGNTGLGDANSTAKLVGETGNGIPVVGTDAIKVVGGGNDSNDGSGGNGNGNGNDSGNDDSSGGNGKGKGK